MRAPDPPRPRTPTPGALWGLLLFPKPPASLRAPGARGQSGPGASPRCHRATPPAGSAAPARLWVSRASCLWVAVSLRLSVSLSLSVAVSPTCARPPAPSFAAGLLRLAGGCLPRPVPSRRSDGGARLRPEAPSPTESGFRSVGCLGSIPATSVPRVTRELAAGSELGGTLPGFSHPPSRAAHSAHTLARTCRSPSPSPPSTRGRGAGTRCCGGRCCPGLGSGRF